MIFPGCFTKYNFCFFLMLSWEILDSLTPLAIARQEGKFWISDEINLSKFPIHWLMSKEWNLPQVQVFNTGVVSLNRLKSVLITTENLIFPGIFSFFHILQNLKIPWYFHDWKSSRYFSRIPRCCGNPVYILRKNAIFIRGCCGMDFLKHVSIVDQLMTRFCTGFLTTRLTD